MNININELTLLYVEDNSETRELTTIILQSYFNNVITAKNGVDGLHKFQNYAVDLIITDIEMPELDGISMIKQIRSINKDIPILVISAYNDTNYLMESIQQSVQGYIIKPIQRKQFKEAISKIKNTIVQKYSQEENNSLLKQYQEITDHSAIVSKTTFQGIITYVNDAFCKVSGYSREELIGHNHNIVRDTEEPLEIFKELWRTISKEKKTWKGVLRNQTKQGSYYYVHTSIKPILDNNEKIKEFISSRVVITDIIRPKQIIQEKTSAINKHVVTMVEEAISTSNIISYFQPIVDNKTLEIIKYESLLRLIDEHENIISPYLFLEDIKDLKCYLQVTLMVLEDTNASISINISMSDILNKKINKKVFELLEIYKDQSHRITFELLEDEQSKKINLIRNFITQIRAYNVQIAIDDFGVGYSNFERIMQYKPDIIKIDGSLIKNIVSDDYSKNMIEAIVMFAKKENILSIAEYVENKEIFDIISALGVDCSQGYYFGKPEKLT
ncbi:MAG: diguanylate cyclase/phosphodiesterase (GGDEF & EAL domains) with PAS/PAC sensor(s) [uncultured Sulfurovum sp.]|uniref:Diguanylate cyclase/phosphodiesterase (GGDEF & EAL domains) with PAS/PAC sensor(S) n=1 Tax=uncultured Sulfurovum sp. TaxID=269237 RepID=A0A6S6T2T4_9BACT|nr:MAG: diguanylate cyclase/phosphodiesterase (GGDEF & EAL domains) with PAS/PAC sensor(s) [uncultured Sulfurovum sp.]